ncbi:TonB-dependent receptor [Roseateles sp.]|uniref:TonB-dependent receptor plug domain-containing protein n=1 Tax=Roseateles sp. TaxID=1971397 RepID=UPI0025EEB698|nr:TonB-dependent receptor [Roseateles sp.]MBV8037776.1 TonB-dependent receptor [Roseateles sp.]
MLRAPIRSLRSFDSASGLSSVAAAALAALALPTALTVAPLEAVAQSEAGKLDSVLVVGSRIRRLDESAPNQVVTLNRKEIEATGVSSVGDLLQQLPSVGSSANSNGSQGTSHGSSSVNLRNLEPNRVLVLVNGRRWVVGAGSRSFRDFVDLNTIPLAAVQNVEILLDGATAIYGSDAIAGVVNIITYQKYEGGQLNLQAGATSRGDGQSRSADVLWGKSGEWGSALVSASFAKSDPIATTDRDWALARYQPIQSTQLPGGVYVVPGVQAGKAFTRVDGAAGTKPSDFRLKVASDVYDTNTDGYLIGPSERKAVYGQARVAISDSLDLIAEGLYNTRESSQRFNPAALVIGGAGMKGQVMPANHAYNPFGSTLSGFTVNRTMVEVGDRFNLQKVETTRLGIGLDGSLANGWTWNAFVSQAENKASFTALNQLNLENVALGIGDTARCAARQCTPIALFGPLTPAMADAVRAPALVGRNGTKSLDMVANITGDIMRLPAGALAFAAGVEYREESAYDQPDAFLNATPQFSGSTTTTGTASTPTDGRYHLSEAYAEFKIPLLAKRPGAHSLEATLATRHSRYSNFGDTLNSKAGLNWRPVQDLMIRGDVAQGFRAPNILELYGGLRSTVFPISADPCDGGGAGLPGCAGVPATYSQAATTAGKVPGITGGNPSLKPETSLNRSLGFVFTPSALKEFSWSMDWYDIKMDNTIQTIDANTLLGLCARTGRGCDVVQRNADGSIANLTAAYLNLASLRVAGLDSTARYGWRAQSLGAFSTALSLSYLDRFEQVIPQSDGSTIHQDLQGTGISRKAYPRIKGSFTLAWQRGAWGANWALRYIGGYTESVQDPTTKQFVPTPVSASVTNDLSMSYSFGADPKRLHSVSLGINNLFDRKPPLSYLAGATDNNFNIGTYDPRGRFVYVKAAVRF